jgi:hypothetical protein
MKRVIIVCFSLALVLLCGARTAARAQNVKGGPIENVLRDPALEKESKHNLEVARHYFKLKKAYRAAIARCEEIIAGNPTFSQLDEVLYIAGVGSLRLSENRGKQAPNLPPDKLRDDARDYLSRVVNEFPESKFREQAETELDPIGGVKPKAVVNSQ